MAGIVGARRRHRMRVATASPRGTSYMRRRRPVAWQTATECHGRCGQCAKRLPQRRFQRALYTDIGAASCASALFIKALHECQKIFLRIVLSEERLSALACAVAGAANLFRIAVKEIIRKRKHRTERKTFEVSPSQACTRRATTSRTSTRRCKSCRGTHPHFCAS